LVDGVSVISPDRFAQTYTPENCFVLLASVDSNTKKMADFLSDLGFHKSIDFETIQTLSPYYPVVEITGVCNLRCPSCIRSNPQLISNGKFMNFDTYREVILKLTREIPFLYLVDLYIWGEPILNPELPKMVALNNELGIASGLSTNLNDIRNLDAVLASLPAQLRVSVSGMSRDTYEITHAGGKWEKVSKNLEILSSLVRKYNNVTTVEFYFHIYKHNLHEISIAQEMCETLGFKFHPALGIILSSDILSLYRSTGNLSAEAESIRDKLLIDVDELIAYCDETRERDCILTRVIPVINWDLSVMPCCNYSYSNTISNNYLSLKLNDLVDLRTNSDLCRKCQSQSLHRWNDQVNYSSVLAGVMRSTSL